MTAAERFNRFLAKHISQWGEQPLQVTLFGSAARRQMRPDSDIDLLFVLEDGASDELYGAISELSVQAYRLTGNDVRPLVYEAAEVGDAPVFDSIVSEGIHISGDPHWLSRHLGRSSVAS